MPITKSALKSVRADKRKEARVKAATTLAKSTVSKAEKAIATSEREQATALTVAAVRSLDRAAAKSVLHRNNAARRKSRLMKKLNKLMAAPVAAPEATKVKSRTTRAKKTTSKKATA